jgi:putative aminopeptidase FrvX
MKKIITPKSEKFLEQYLNNASPTGFESPGQKLWMDYMRPFTDEFIIDNYGSVAAVINPGKPYKVVIEAHADEISWFVHYITSDGFIYLRRNGGSDHMIAPSKRVNIHTDKGIVRAVFGWPAIHMRHTKDEAPSMKNIFLDCGCATKEEVEKLGVHNRVGGFMIAEVARMLKEKKVSLPFSLYVVNAVQEEIGLRGAEMIAHRIKPDVALITDVCHDTGTPMVSKIENGDQKSGEGPVLTYGPAVQNNFLRQIIQVAEKNKIPFQRAAASRSTGTDTDAFAYSNEGVTSALISLPLRYMHTTVEMVRKEDVESCIALIFETVKSIKAGQDFRYLK